ncbi:type II toxin-antitoxin system RelE/ParE family toxin [Adhaeribacter rhizoryzae]|uniref:Type II toxin-antitoxin system RelE/ParE family toxin n=1 Tax=Adhaeribacter rhizoryzae TaxID=2607907 RepID=A0A5M6DNP6_9BACT|nr:type II toxin-antitoxin system RelE/ParE family toxin [Adhaeribacter rhizoryzae]KAA5549127.1 type II toxin-antitoxin system RelE/ParE family toxin [Adhaeribacter rhizoryzae]
MVLRVLWTSTASGHLENIFDYYKITANLTIARKLVKSIVRKISALSKHPNISQHEPLLADRQKEYRYIVEGNYKIIYWVDAAAIYIAAVFDTRQNPDKI